MKQLLKKTMSIYLSLSLVLGLIVAPTMDAKAGMINDGYTDFENYTAGNSIQGYPMSENSYRTANVNGYDFTMYTNGRVDNCLFMVSKASIGSNYSNYFNANVSSDPTELEQDLLEKLVVSRNNESFDLKAIELAFLDNGATYNSIILQGYDKNGNSIGGAYEIKSGKSISYQGGDNLAFDVSGIEAFKGIYSFAITPGSAKVSNTSFFIKSITAKSPENTPPTAKSVNIAPDSYGEYLDGIYDYSDAEGNTEGGSLFQWYRSDEINGTETPIPGAMEIRYYITNEDYGKWLRFEVTPREEGLDGLTGNSAKSGFYEIMLEDNGSGSGDTDELDALKVEIESYRGGGNNQVFNAEVNKSEKTVTVTGMIYRANETLSITIPENVKVIWKAEFGGDGNRGSMDLLRVDGAGTFELAEEGNLVVEDYNSLYDHNVLIAGEELSSILVTGGSINAYSGHAIFVSGDKTTVEVSAGVLNSLKGDTIYVSGSNSIVKISGGTVNSSNGASIYSNGDVLISGGKVDNNIGKAVYSGGNVYISGTGMVVSAQGTGIQLKKVGIIEVTGGVVFAGSDMNNNDMTVYKITNGSKVLYSEGNGTMVSWERTNKRMSYPYGSKFDLYAFSSPSKVTWTTDMGRPGVLIDNGIYKAFVPTYGITITDVPETPVNRTVTFNDGGLDSITKSVTSGTSLGVDNWPVNPVKTGYTFSGWYTGENGSGTVFIPNTLVNADITVYAKWTAVTNNPDPVTVNSVTIKSAPTKTTYRVGEALDLSGLVVTLNKSDGTTENIPFENFETKGITTNPTNGRKLISELSVVIIKYLENNQSVNQQLTILPALVNRIVTFQYGDLDTITKSVTDGTSLGSNLWPTAPVKAGYTFGGWYTGETGSGSVFTSSTVVNADITVYAKWTVVTSGGSDSNNNNSGDNSNNNSGTTGSGTEQITVDVKEGNTDSVASQITIERTTNDNGEKSDKVIYHNDKAVETVQKLKAEGKDTARIVIPDEKDQVSETKVNIPVATIGTLAGGNINLQIDTEEAIISISKESIISASQLLKDDLYFHLVPVKNEAEKENAIQQAKIKASLVRNNANPIVSIIGNPITIETNMPSSETSITLPLIGVVIPTNKADKEALLKQLAVYIEHSDGDKELVQGELVEFKNGVYGIRFHINKFSLFTIVKTDAFLKSSAKEISKLTTPANAVIKGSNITATVGYDVDRLTVKATVSDKSTWKLYLDKELKKEAVNGKLQLNTGVNTSYIKVTAQDKTTKIYKITITRSKSSKADITKLIMPEKAVMKGNSIAATVENEKDSLTVKANLSSKATLKIYSDKALKKEIANNKLKLKVGTNTVYLKVTAGNGTSIKVYTLKITRKAGDYKSHVRLGVIGSGDYANRVAEIFKVDYDSANVVIKKVGKYYLVTMDFKDKSVAKKACEDMIRREYIINYYFN